VGIRRPLGVEGSWAERVLEEGRRWIPAVAAAPRPIRRRSSNCRNQLGEARGQADRAFGFSPVRLRQQVQQQLGQALDCFRLSSETQRFEQVMRIAPPWRGLPGADAAAQLFQDRSSAFRHRRFVARGRPSRSGRPPARCGTVSQRSRLRQRSERGTITSMTCFAGDAPIPPRAGETDRQAGSRSSTTSA